jgi:hypothetical protein
MRKSVVFATAMTVWLMAFNADAMPAFARAYKQQYGLTPSCNACHTDGGGSTLNAFGNDFKEAGKSDTAFALVADKDSDGDGDTNGAEAQAKSNPGDKASTIAVPGKWLDMASLIPKEVQAAFPGVLTWLPRDAILTTADISAAAGMGATLSAADENTIYIPVQNQRPAGTALIFPVTFQGNTGFLLMTTDHMLKITSVSVLHADKLQAAKDSQIYASFVGQAAQSVSAPVGETIDAAITRAVKNAGVLLYVRLKGA